MRLCIVIVNYRTPGLVLDVLESLNGQLEPGLDQIVVVDNASGDDSADRIEHAVVARGFSSVCRVVRSPRNGGFSAGNNIGIRAVEASLYLLLNSDTIVREGAIPALLADMQAHPHVGLAGPRLEGPDGVAQVSCFRDHTPVSELLAAAKTGPITTLFQAYEVALPVSDEAIEPQWLSFACVLIRREVIEKVGLLDEGYFMYFEDSDYCRAARAAGFRIAYFPTARVVHLSGGTSDVKKRMAARRRPPRYFYASRTRYFRKGYGVFGLWAANALWQVGRTVSWGRELLGQKTPHTCQLEWFDNWTDTLKLLT
jgi:N-acetylglucosaminyl-diphospho-decaprenol L-rhamnosyltransferase